MRVSLLDTQQYYDNIFFRVDENLNVVKRTNFSLGTLLEPYAKLSMSEKKELGCVHFSWVINLQQPHTEQHHFHETIHQNRVLWTFKLM